MKKIKKTVFTMPGVCASDVKHPRENDPTGARRALPFKISFSQDQQVKRALASTKNAVEALEKVKSLLSRLTYDIHRASLNVAIKEFSNPQSNVFEHLFPAISRFIESSNLLGELEAVVPALNEDAKRGRKKQKVDKKRTKISTKTIQKNQKKLMEATWSEVSDILKIYKDGAGHPYTLAIKIKDRIEKGKIKNENEILIKENPTIRTLATYIRASPKPSN